MPPRRRRRSYQAARPPHPQLLLSLIDLYQLLRAPQPLDRLLQAILDTAIAYVPGAQRGSLMVAEGESLRYRATYGYDLEQLRAVSIPVYVEQDLVLMRGRVVQVLDFTEWDRAHLSAEMNRILHEYGKVAEIRRSLVTAIVVGGRFYGSLVLDNLHDYAPFPPEAETLARLLAEQAGALLEQALLIEQLRQTNTMLVEAEKLAALGRFIASIAHEINNPLTAVIGYADLLDDSQLAPDVRDMLEQVRLGAERVRTIVHNLQVFARQQRSGEQTVSLNLLVEQALMLKRGDYALDMIATHTELAPDMPLIWADGGQLSQVLLNLLVNAQHALRQRPLPRELSIRTVFRPDAAEAARLQLRVRDNGPGMMPEVLSRAFEPFFTTRPPGQGTGLGLSICAEIAQRHGGSIRAISEPGAGAEFIIELPVRPGRPAAEPVSRPPPRRAAPAGLRILAVDDDPVVQVVLRRTLKERNMMVVTGSGAEALRMLGAVPFDLVLCDLKMPEIDGEMLYRRVLAEHPAAAARFLFISGDTSNAALRAFLEAAGRPLLAKPFTAGELFAAIAGVVGPPAHGHQR